MGRGITLWTRYSRLGASSRLRFFQYLPFLEEAGFSPEIGSFFDDDYLRRLYSGRGRNLSALLTAYHRYQCHLESQSDMTPTLRP